MTATVRFVRFERWPAKGAVQVMQMMFKSVPEINGMPGVIGEGTARGAMYAIGLTLHDIQWMLEEAEREADQARARHSESHLTAKIEPVLLATVAPLPSPGKDRGNELATSINRVGTSARTDGPEVAE